MVNGSRVYGIQVLKGKRAFRISGLGRSGF